MASHPINVLSLCSGVGMTRERNAEGQFLASHGMRDTRTWAIWMGMRSRCIVHPRYAGRGIKVCERWQSFENFLTDMGEAPAGMSLDRKQNAGDYEPDNCRWATPKQQARNTRRCVMLEFNGEAACISEWAEKTGISVATLWARIKAGWDTERALTTSVRKCG